MAQVDFIRLGGSLNLSRLRGDEGLTDLLGSLACEQDFIGICLHKDYSLVKVVQKTLIAGLQDLFAHYEDSKSHH